MKQQEQAPTNWLGWVVGTVAVGGAVVGGVYLVRKYVILKTPDAPSEVPTEPSQPGEIVRPPIPVPTREGMEAPQPTTADGEPLAGSEAPDLVRHGMEVNESEHALAVQSFPQWRNWATQALPNLRFAVLSGRAIADRLLHQAFPELPERVSEDARAWTMNGRPYEEIAEQLDAYQRAFRAGFFQPKHWNPQDTFARVMVGDKWVPYRQELGTLPPAASVEFLLDQVIATVPRSQTHPGLGQSVTVWDWYHWPAGVGLLSPGTTAHRGTESKRADAIKRAVEAMRLGTT